LCFSADSRLSAHLTGSVALIMSCTTMEAVHNLGGLGHLGAAPQRVCLKAMSRVTSKTFVRSPPVLLKLVSEPA
jgi:hypothetical protein